MGAEPRLVARCPVSAPGPRWPSGGFSSGARVTEEPRTMALSSAFFSVKTDAVGTVLRAAGKAEGARVCEWAPPSPWASRYLLGPGDTSAAPRPDAGRGEPPRSGSWGSVQGRQGEGGCSTRRRREMKALRPESHTPQEGSQLPYLQAAPQCHGFPAQGRLGACG